MTRQRGFDFRSIFGNLLPVPLSHLGNDSVVKENVFECSLLIPVRRDANLSDGEPHSPRAWEWLDKHLFVNFDGGTQAPGLYEGFYRDPDTRERVNDQSVKFIVAVPSSAVDRLRLLLAKACLVFQQKCIYLSIGGRVEFIEPYDYEIEDLH